MAAMMPQRLRLISYASWSANKQKGTSADSRNIRKNLDEIVTEVFESQPKQSSAMYGHAQQVQILVEKGSSLQGLFPCHNVFLD